MMTVEGQSAGASRWCEHDSAVAGPAICQHLAVATDDVPYDRWFTGVSIESEQLCHPCSNAREGGADIETRVVCESCSVATFDEWGDLRRVHGEPEVLHRPEVIDTHIEELDLPLDLVGVSVAVADDLAETSFVLTSNWQILKVDHASGAVDAVAKLNAADLEQTKLDADTGDAWVGHQARPTLHVSADAAFAAIAIDFGQFGAAIDLQSGTVSMALDGGDYRPDTVPFSVGFVNDSEGKPLLVHRTAWNRLDISNPVDGVLLTERGPTEYENDTRPQHYLDYFHGRLFVSPNRERVLDDGWVWHPAGVPRIWSIPAWLSNVWESETGRSLREPSQRDYYWNHGYCWLTDDIVAIDGIGSDDELMRAGVTIFDLTTTSAPSGRRPAMPAEVGMFAGPAGTLFGHDNRLFSVKDNVVSVWDVTAGALIATVDNFEPTAHSRLDRTLISATGSRVRMWHY